MILYIVANHSPKQVTDWLQKKCNITPKYTSPTKRSTGLHFVFGLQEYKLCKDLQRSKVKIILFEGPITAMSIKGAKLLDLKINKEAPYYGIEYSSLNYSVFKKAEHEQCTIEKYDYANNIIESIESKSILNPLMTAIYTVSSSAQKPVKIAVVNWLSYDGKVKNLPNLLTKLSDNVKLNSNNIAQLNSVLQSELATIYTRALKQGGDVNELAEEYNISAYDLSYILSVRSSKAEYKRNNK